MANSVRVKYFDPLGKAHEGYIINNKTYKDPEGKERVELGSVVETAGGTYTLTKNGGVKTNFLEENYDEAEEQLNSAKRAAKLALEKKYKTQAYDIENYKKNAKKDYADAISRNNQKKEASEKKLNQLLKAQGISGGASESSIIANSILYEENNNELMRDLNKTISDYDMMLLKLADEMEYEIMKSNSEYDSLYAQLLSERANAQNDNLSNEIDLYAQNYRFNTEQESKALENQRNYERAVYEDERDYNRGVYEDERDYNRGIYEDERDYNRGVYENNRSYNLSASKAASSSSSSKDDDKEYSRQLKNSEVLSSFGDYSGYAKLFGWTFDQQTKAQKEYYLK